METFLSSIPSPTNLQLFRRHTLHFFVYGRDDLPD